MCMVQNKSEHLSPATSLAHRWRLFSIFPILCFRWRLFGGGGREEGEKESAGDGKEGEKESAGDGEGG